MVMCTCQAASAVSSSCISTVAMVIINMLSCMTPSFMVIINMLSCMTPSFMVIINMLSCMTPLLQQWSPLLQQHRATALMTLCDAFIATSRKFRKSVYNIYRTIKHRTQHTTHHCTLPSSLTGTVEAGVYKRNQYVCKQAVKKHHGRDSTIDV